MDIYDKDLARIRVFSLEIINLDQSAKDVINKLGFIYTTRDRFVSLTHDLKNIFGVRFEHGNIMIREDIEGTAVEIEKLNDQDNLSCDKRVIVRIDQATRNRLLSILNDKD